MIEIEETSDFVKAFEGLGYYKQFNITIYDKYVHSL